MMKVLVSAATGVPGTLHELYLEPETMADQFTLDRLEGSYQTVGCGRHEDGRYLHVRVELVPIKEASDEVG